MELSKIRKSKTKLKRVTKYKDKKNAIMDEIQKIEKSVQTS